MGMKLHIGGAERRDGWTVVDARPGEHVDIVADCRSIPLPNESVESIYASHVLEHVPMHEVRKTLRHWWRLLQSQGQLAIAVPDMTVLAKLLLDDMLSTEARIQVMQLIYGGHLHEHDVHHAGFTEELICAALNDAGFGKIERHKEFGLFRDCSYVQFLGLPFSINLVAQKQGRAEFAYTLAEAVDIQRPGPNPIVEQVVPLDVPDSLLRGQLGADRFVIEALGHKRNGRYLDIGAGEPYYLSNTLALERHFGWTGVLCDIAYAEALRKERTGFVLEDATSVDWRHVCGQLAVDGRIDFLSLDLEPPTLTENVLRALPLESVRFSIIAIEHDSHREGGEQRAERMRSLLASHGYELFASILFDDWWVDPAVLDVTALQDRFAALLEIAE